MHGYILHRRPWRETSLLLDLWTPQGRLPAIAKGAREARSAHRGLLQPMQYLVVSWFGKSNIKTIRSVDVADKGLVPRRHLLQVCGLYANELLVRTVLPEDEAGELFNAYHQLVQHLQQQDGQEPNSEQLEYQLRSFELSLLQQLGYGLNLQHTAQGKPVRAEQHYEFRRGEGLCECKNGLPGEHILNLARGDLNCPKTRRSARRLMRDALKPLLGEQPLYTRELFWRAQ